MNVTTYYRSYVVVVPLALALSFTQKNKSFSFLACGSVVNICGFHYDLIWVTFLLVRYLGEVL